MTKTILHCLGWYPPDSSGGTEVYVESLCSELLRREIQSVVAAPVQSGLPGSYRHNGIVVRRFLPDDPGWLKRVVADLRLDGQGHSGVTIYHQHTWNAHCGLGALETAKELGLKTVLTVHVPGVICLRGTMMWFGEVACDGRIDERRCAACWMQGRGMPKPLAQLMGAVPLAVAVWAGGLVKGRLRTLLNSRRMVRERQQQFTRMVAAADRIVAVSQWLRDALLHNGVSESKLVMSRQGVAVGLAGACQAPKTVTEAVRIGYLGRWSREKGLDILLAAFSRVPKHCPVELWLYGMANTEEDMAYRDELVRRYAGEPRLHVAEPVARDRITQVMQTFHVLAVPSQWLETGPLVVLEAQAAGVPVLGSALGGIQEFIGAGTPGWLVSPPDSPDAWAQSIQAVVEGRLRWGAPWPAARTMDAVATEMAELYRGLLPESAPPSA